MVPAAQAWVDARNIEGVEAVGRVHRADGGHGDDLVRSHHAPWFRRRYRNSDGLRHVPVHGHEPEIGRGDVAFSRHVARESTASLPKASPRASEPVRTHVARPVRRGPVRSTRPRFGCLGRCIVDAGCSYETPCRSSIIFATISLQTDRSAGASRLQAGRSLHLKYLARGLYR